MANGRSVDMQHPQAQFRVYPVRWVLASPTSVHTGLASILSNSRKAEGILHVASSTAPSSARSCETRRTPVRPIGRRGAAPMRLFEGERSHIPRDSALHIEQRKQRCNLRRIRGNSLCCGLYCGYSATGSPLRRVGIRGDRSVSVRSNERSADETGMCCTLVRKRTKALRNPLLEFVSILHQ